MCNARARDNDYTNTGKAKALKTFLSFFLLKVSSQCYEKLQVQQQQRPYVCKMPQNIVKERIVPGTVPSPLHFFVSFNPHSKFYYPLFIAGDRGLRKVREISQI